MLTRHTMMIPTTQKLFKWTKSPSTQSRVSTSNYFKMVKTEKSSYRRLSIRLMRVTGAMKLCPALTSMVLSADTRLRICSRTSLKLIMAIQVPSLISSSIS